MGSRGSTDPAESGAPPERWHLSRVEMLVILGFWTFYALLIAGNRILDPRGPGLQSGVQWGPVLLAFVEAYLWALLTPPVFWLSSRFNLERSDWAPRVLLLLAAGFVAAIAVDLVSHAVAVQVLPLPRRRSFDDSALRRIARLWFLRDLVVYFGVLAAGFARDYFLRYRARQEQATRLEAETALLQAQLTEARLQTLRMQINPHFLFNTLHAVSSLVERDPRGVRRMIARLSELLRYTLEGTSAQEVPLEQELRFLEGYLEIMRIRFGGRLEVEMEIAPDAMDALVPNLILQPLVENAIQHGAGKTEGTGRVAVRGERRGERLHLEVRDNGPLPPGTPIQEGVGLGNTRARLAQLYGDAQSLGLRPAEGGGLVAEISLPFHTAAELRAAIAIPISV